MKDMQLYPLLRIAIFMMAGIVAGDALMPVVPSWCWLALMGLSVLGYLMLRERPVGQTLAVFSAVLAFGAWLTALHEHRLQRPLPQGEVAYRAVLLSQPVERGKVVRCDLLVMRGKNPYKVKAAFLRDTLTARYRRLNIGDGIIARSRMEPPRNFREGSNFDYVRWLQTHGFVATTFVYYRNWQKAAVDISALSAWERAKLRALVARQRLIRSWAVSDDQAAAVLAAMTLGDKSMLSPTTKDDYAISGASHVLALSGLHLTIIYGILLVLLFRVRYKEMLALPAIWAYVVLVGMSPSVMRAATMLTVYAFVSLLNRDRQLLNTLSLSAIVLLIGNPLCLYDVGFQMSFMAVLGIVLFRSSSRNRVIQFVTVSLAAQLATAPLVAYYFGRIPTYFLLTNMVVVPAVTLILYGMVAALLLQVFHLSVVPYLLAGISLLNSFLSKVAELPYASIENVRLSFVQLIAVYVLIASIYYGYQMVKDKSRPLHRIANR